MKIAMTSTSGAVGNLHNVDNVNAKRLFDGILFDGADGFNIKPEFGMPMEIHLNQLQHIDFLFEEE